MTALPDLSDKASRFLKSLVHTLLFLGVASIPVCFVIVLFYYPKAYPQVFSWSEIPFVALGILAEGLLLYAVARMKARRLPVALAMAWLNAACALIIAIVPTVPASDYSIIWDTACRMASGDFHASSLVYNDYLYFNNYQLGISMLESWIVRIFGQSFLALKIVCLLCVNLTAWLVYRLIRRTIGTKAAVNGLVLFATFYPVIATVGQFTNQHLAAPIIITIIICLSHRSLKHWICAGLLSGALAFIRPMMILTFLTMAVWGIYLLLSAQWGRRRVIIMLMLSFFAAQSLVTSLGNLYMHRSDLLTPGSITVSANPYFKFEKGLTGYDVPLWDGIGSTEEFNRLERQRITEAITRHPLDVLAYVARKMIRYQGEFDYKVENTYNHDERLWNRTPVKQSILFGWGQYIVLSVAAAIGLWRALRRRRQSAAPLAPWQIFYVGNLYVYFLIEAFSSYRYESYPYLMLMAAAALLAGKDNCPPPGHNITPSTK